MPLSLWWGSLQSCFLSMNLSILITFFILFCLLPSHFPRKKKCSFKKPECYLSFILVVRIINHIRVLIRKGMKRVEFVLSLFTTCPFSFPTYILSIQTLLIWTFRLRVFFPTRTNLLNSKINTMFFLGFKSLYSWYINTIHM